MQRQRDREHHASLDEVARYTKAADQAQLARNAMARTA
jgi:hypothetical protein